MEIIHHDPADWTEKKSRLWYLWQRIGRKLKLKKEIQIDRYTKHFGFFLDILNTDVIHFIPVLDIKYFSNRFYISFAFYKYHICMGVERGDYGE